MLKQTKTLDHAAIKAMTYAAPKPKKRGGRTISGTEPSYRADRTPRRASGGRTKHPAEEHTTIILADPGIAGFPTPMMSRPAAPVAGRPAGLYGPSRKGEAYGISSAAGTTMKRGGAISHGESLSQIRRRTQP